MEWISAKDRLPEKDGQYMVQDEYDNVCVMSFTTSLENEYGFKDWEQGEDWIDHPGFFMESYNKWNECDGIDETIVKYWQPLPKPVSEEKHDSKYIDICDKIWHDFVDYVRNKYHVNLEEILDEEDEKYIGKFFKASFLTSVGMMADDIGPIVSDVLKEKVNERLKELGYEQTVSSSRSEEEAGDLEGNRQDGKA